MKQPNDVLDEWEEVDVEDAKPEELEDDNQEDADKRSLSAISIEKSESGTSEPGFSIIDSAKKVGKSASSFSKVDLNSDKIKQEPSQDLHFSTDSIEAIHQTKLDRKAVSREEAIKGLKVKKAKLLETGEILLGNGKIIGHRAFAYIYKQKVKLPDKRESVLLNKLSVEYRRIKNIADGKDMKALKKAEPKLYRNLLKQA